MILNKRIIFLISFSFCSLFAAGQNEDSLSIAKNLHYSYQFQEAINIYKSLLNNSSDSVFKIRLEENIIQCENGISLLQYATIPTSVAKGVFPADSFALYISDLRDSSWISLPNPIVDSRAHKFYSSIYFPEELDTLYYSAPDNSGAWNIYQIHHINDNLWSEPQLLNEQVTTSGDEIFPILSADRKELYFASNGHFGMGGFDLYVTKWDDTIDDWSTPENLGFPFSSTGDDLFYLDTSDGQYTILASNRNARADSVEIIVLEYIETPVKKPISLIDAKNIAPLSPFIKEKQQPLQEIKKTEELIPEENGMSTYSELVSQMRGFQNELKKLLDELEENRALLEKLESEDDKEFLKEMIADSEMQAQAIRKKLEGASSKVQAAEMEFLSKGIIPQFEEPVEKEKPVVEEVGPRYTFSKHTPSEIRDIEMEKPVPQFDYSFKILPEAQYAESNTLPATLVYQIQLIVTSSKTSLKSLKGLSPIFEKKQPSGKYLYTVGLFYSHTEALSCLNKVRKAGFPKAFVVAFNNGKSLSIRDAKVMEKSIVSNNPAYQVVLTDYPEGIPSPIIAAIRESCEKDIAKSLKDGNVIYIVGPFAEKANADYVFKILSGLGVNGISVESVKK